MNVPDTRRVAYRAGREAFKAGQLADACPYRQDQTWADLDNWKLWLAGYEHELQQAQMELNK